MHRRRRQPLLIVLLVLTSLGLWHRQAMRGPTSPVAAMRSAPDGVPQADDLPLEVESPVTRPVAARTGARSAASPVVAAASHAAMPPDTPATELWDALAPRARAGDATAACELGRALVVCRFLATMPSYEPPELPDDASDEDRQDRARWQRRQQRSRQLCTGLDEPQLAAASRLLLQAAEAGHRESIVMASQMISPLDLLDDPALWVRYRARMWPLLQQALAAGDRNAYAVLVQAASWPHNEPMSRVIPARYRDADTAEALRYLMLTPEQREADGRAPPSEAQAEAQRWLDELSAGTLAPEQPLHLDEDQLPDPATCHAPEDWLPR